MPARCLRGPSAASEPCPGPGGCKPTHPASLTCKTLPAMRLCFDRRAFARGATGRTPTHCPSSARDMANRFAWPLGPLGPGQEVLGSANDPNALSFSRQYAASRCEKRLGFYENGCGGGDASLCAWLARCGGRPVRGGDGVGRPAPQPGRETGLVWSRRDAQPAKGVLVPKLLHAGRSPPWTCDSCPRRSSTPGRAPVRFGASCSEQHSSRACQV